MTTLFPSRPTWYQRYAKALLAAAAGLTPAAVLAILSGAGIDVGPAWVPFIPAVLAVLAVWRGPANTPDVIVPQPRREGE
jgi:hypothetical protein